MRKSPQEPAKLEQMNDAYWAIADGFLDGVVVKSGHRAERPAAEGGAPAAGAYANETGQSSRRWTATPDLDQAPDQIIGHLFEFVY